MNGIPITLLPPMLHSSEAKCPDDDWSGLRDKAERRKRQNRLNVRAHRKKKATEDRQKNERQAKETRDIHLVGLMRQSASAPTLQINQWVPPVKPSQANRRIGSRNESPVDEKSKSSRNSNEQNLGIVVRGRSEPQLPGSIPPYYRNPARWFPLYRDHLIPLVYYNVFRATITNIHILSLTSLLGSPCTPDLHTTPLFPAPSQIPPTLLPTALQRSTLHESWIDIFPSGGMRDNAIRYRHTFDHHELCIDLVGCSESDACGDQPGIIAWSDPWHPEGWEVTDKFVEKWGFLLKGCDDVMRATNRWRAMRDEEPLVWEVD